ncbi:MAG: TIR domain-containing protein [Candidatus Udaeobacter sp.]
MTPKSSPAAVAGTQQPLGLTQPEKIFIVYGHDTVAREQLELLLRRLKLEPVILANMVAEGQTIIEMLEKHRSGVRYACVYFNAFFQKLRDGEALGFRSDLE